MPASSFEGAHPDSRGFVLDPQLDNDTFEIGRLALSRVLLMNDARFPWLILVPERAGMAELIDLGDAPADPQAALQALPIASSMTRLSILTSSIRTPMIVKTRI